ncbi:MULTISPECIES: ABC transporter permease [Aliivibrio]|uniref:ABC transporter permease n=1 Tax=Aliivibrio finisterrensis TaxID=511998 RepID=A0A4V1Z8G1_9GAMM|nr:MULTISPECIES: FtsX-like permease family protein [Aliivibrio]MDD9180370.1 ABC transporter permease [Aliivibrio sp. A6]RYU48985.1 ABC transporter permease [Aliivibrio finisterrensis]RYU49265.1 ABC transporter permease [Aliivibrio finisterrensis]RYU54556.1 ABC transporter permease [Aliivibrio finisterrensis]RYU61215.1 ABC transporter permease [Aliivibrio finisterrensis]
MLVKLAWRNVWRNKLRTSIMLGAMIFGVAGVMLMMGFMNGIIDNLVKNTIQWQTSHIQIHQKNYALNPDINLVVDDEAEITKQLEQAPQVKAWTSRTLVNGMIASARSTRGIQINGIDLESEPKITPIADHILEGEWLDNKGRNPILVSQKTADRLKLRAGSKVVLTFTDTTGDVTGAAFRVRGIFKTSSSTFDDANAYVRKADIQQLGQVHFDHEIAILLHDEAQVSDFREQLMSSISNKNKVQDWLQLQPILSTMMSSMNAGNQVILVIFVIAMGFGIINILLMSVFERTREFGVLMAVGMKKGNIRRLIILESGFIGIIGAGSGVIFSLFLLFLLSKTGIPLEAMAEGLNAFGIDSVLYPSVAFSDYVTVFVTVWCVSVLAGLYPAHQIIKKKPVEAMAEKQ